MLRDLHASAFPNVGIEGMHHHTWSLKLVLNGDQPPREQLPRGMKLLEQCAEAERASGPRVLSTALHVPWRV